MSTTRSRRRDAELAVIEAATVVAQQFARYGGGSCSHTQAVALSDALQAYWDSPEDPEPPARTGLDNPCFTSSQAAEWMERTGQRKTLGRRVFNIVATVHGTRGVSTEEVERLLGRSHQSVSPRVTELRDRGLIMAGGKTTLNDSGREATLWTLTELGRQAWTLRS